MSANWLWVKMGCNKYDPTYDFCSMEEICQLVQQQQGDFNQDLVKIYSDFHAKHEDDYEEPEEFDEDEIVVCDGCLSRIDQATMVRTESTFTETVLEKATDEINKATTEVVDKAISELIEQKQRELEEKAA